MQKNGKKWGVLLPKSTPDPYRSMNPGWPAKGAQSMCTPFLLTHTSCMHSTRRIPLPCHVNERKGLFATSLAWWMWGSSRVEGVGIPKYLASLLHEYQGYIRLITYSQSSKQTHHTFDKVLYLKREVPLCKSITNHVVLLSRVTSNTMNNTCQPARTKHCR